MIHHTDSNQYPKYKNGLPWPLMDIEGIIFEREMLQTFGCFQFQLIANFKELQK